MKKREQTQRVFIEPCLFGGYAVVRETWLDCLPWYWKLVLVIGTFCVFWFFTVPVLDFVFQYFL